MTSVMSRTPLFHAVGRTLGKALYASRNNLRTSEALERLAEAEASRRIGRRGFLGLAAAGVAGCAVDVVGISRQALRIQADIGIVGAGFAGLGCANELLRYGIAATIHEASDRIGGRCWSLGGEFPGPVEFPGQVVERGGELIDTTHGTLKGWARELDLELETVIRGPGEVFYRFGGQSYAEDAVVEEFRVFVDAMRDDLRRIGEPTADAFTDDDALFDRMSLAEYLEARGAGPVVRAALDVAYEIEFGLETSEQSALNLLLFMHADRRSRFQPFGIWSDERYHVRGGNQAIARGLADRLSGQIHTGRRLERVERRTDGKVALTLREGRRSIEVVHDAVVLALPFSVLREVELSDSLELPAWKRTAIEELRYGTNAKNMVGFVGPYWLSVGCSGASYSDLPNHQATWETNPSQATAAHAVLTDYSGGTRGASLDPRRPSQEAARFVADLQQVVPGATSAVATKADGSILAHLEHWPSSPYVRGSYTCNHPGYFTTIADNEAKPVGNLLFAGEHTSSFYEWQGFMEGAALSGLRAAGEIVSLFR